jgi:hypothetical protein
MIEILRTSLPSDGYSLQAILLGHGIRASTPGEHSLGTIAGGVQVVLPYDQDLGRATTTR